jgi:predicted transposase/invertase (TIGR01784 family)
LIGTFEQKQALVEQFNLMDDDFFAVVMQHKDACEYVLRVLLDKEITVLETKTQYSIRNLQSHSVQLDALIEDTDGKLYNVEIQVSDRDSHPRRVRYYQSAIDWSVLEKGAKYEDLPDLYLVFISAFDVFGLGKTKYEIERTIKGTDLTADNGVHEVYFNTKANDGTLISQLLEYFNNSDADNPKFGALSERVHFQKRTPEGVDSMCQSVHVYGDEREEIGIDKGIAIGITKGRAEGIEIGVNKGRAEGIEIGVNKGKIGTVKNLLDDGITLEKALKLADLDRETYENYKDNIE